MVLSTVIQRAGGRSGTVGMTMVILSETDIDAHEIAFQIVQVTVGTIARRPPRSSLPWRQSGQIRMAAVSHEVWSCARPGTATGQMLACSRVPRSTSPTLTRRYRSAFPSPVPPGAGLTTLWGTAAVFNQISRNAKDYLAGGGLGGIIGDGQLPASGPEQIFEAYYSLAAFSYARISGDYQFINNPALRAPVACPVLSQFSRLMRSWQCGKRGESSPLEPLAGAARGIAGSSPSLWRYKSRIAKPPDKMAIALIQLPRARKVTTRQFPAAERPVLPLNHNATAREQATKL
jgi:hypothetical protein